MRSTVFLFLMTSLFWTACTYDKLVPLPSCPEEIVLELIERQGAACGSASGSLLVGATNATALSEPLEFSLGGGEFQAEGAFTGLAAGTYRIDARSGDCTAEITVDIVNADGLNASLVTSESACGGNSGTITIVATDATGEVSYSLDGGTAQTDPVFTGLGVGAYQIEVSDEADCSLVLEAQILSDVQFENVRTIVNSSCALSDCHGGNVVPDFRVAENIVARASSIKSRSGSRNMPPSSSGISLTESQIDAIACWVDDGAQQ